MPGLLSSFFPDMAANPLYQGFDQNRNALSQAFLGAAGSGSSMAGIRNFSQGLYNGSQVDTAKLKELVAQKKQEEQTNRTLEFMKTKYPDLASAVQSGVPLGEAYSEMWRRMAPGYDAKAGSAASNMPASIQEWQYFNALPQEDQARYLGMKRSNPYLDIGTGFVQPNPVAPGTASGPEIAKDNYTPAVDKAAGAEVGKYAGQAPERQKAATVALDNFGRKQQIVVSNVDRALAAIDGNPALMTGFVGDLIKAIPGTPQYDLAMTLNTIKANVGFDQLQQMRDASPTGGALGQVSEMENRLLQAVNGALEPGQSAPQLRQNLATIKELYSQLLAERQAAFAKDFGGQQQAAPAQTGGWTVLGVE